MKVSVVVFTRSAQLTLTSVRRPVVQEEEEEEAVMKRSTCRL